MGRGSVGRSSVGPSGPWPSGPSGPWLRWPIGAVVVRAIGARVGRRCSAWGPPSVGWGLHPVKTTTLDSSPIERIVPISFTR